MSCPNLKTYNDVRKEKLEKINQYHKGSEDSLLVKYQSFTNATDNDTTMKQKYKKQMDTLNKEMMDLLSVDVSLLIEQHNELESKTKEVDANDEALKDIKNKIESETVTSDARLKNNFDMIDLEKNHKFYHNLYFYLNVLVLVSVIGLLIYMYLNY